MGKKFIFYLTLFATTMLTACGNVQEPAQPDVLKALEEKGYVTEEGIENGDYTVQINETKVSDSGEKATIECVVTHENAVVRTSTEYKIKFELGDDEELWEVKSVFTKRSTQELINTIQEDDLKDLLQREKINVEDEYIYFNDNHTTYTVSNHEVNSGEMTDVVTLKVNGNIGYKNVTATVKYTVFYDVTEVQWKMQKKEITGIESSFVEGYKEELSTERVWKDVLSKNDYAYVLGHYYFWEDESISISNIRVGTSVYDGLSRKVPVSITVNCENMSFDINYDTEYRFDSEGNWVIKRLTGMQYDNFNCNLIGKWSGRFEDNQTVVTINNFCHASNQSCLDVIVDVTTSAGVSYSYSAYVCDYIPSSSYVSIVPYDVIGYAPEGSHLTNFNGFCNGKEITPYTVWDDFDLKKAN